MTNPEIDRCIRQLAHPRRGRQAVDNLVRYGSDAVMPLCQALGSESWEARQNASLALGRIRDARAVEPLLKLPMARQFFASRDAKNVEALVKIGSAAVEPLCQALGHEDDFVRMHVAQALGKIGDVRAVEPLCKALGDTDRDVRMYVSGALAKFGDKTTRIGFLGSGVVVDPGAVGAHQL